MLKSGSICRIYLLANCVRQRIFSAPVVCCSRDFIANKTCKRHTVRQKDTENMQFLDKMIPNSLQWWKWIWYTPFMIETETRDNVRNSPCPVHQQNNHWLTSNHIGMTYTLRAIKKTCRQTFVNFFTKYWSILIISLLGHSADNLQQNCHWSSHHPLNASLHYLVKHKCCVLCAISHGLTKIWTTRDLAYHRQQLW